MFLWQEDSKVWFGRFNKRSLEIEGTLAVYHFPRSETCQPLYCNIEGIAWIDDLRIVATSDKAKSDQPWSCTLKHQSIHQFMLPRPLPDNIIRPRKIVPNMKCPKHPKTDMSATTPLEPNLDAPSTLA